MKKQKSVKTLTKASQKRSGKTEIEIREEQIYREINSRSFGQNFTILIHHYKKQIEKNPPNLELP